VLDQRLAIGRGPQPARLALEQWQPDIVLQVLQPFGKARLGRVQHGRRLAHIAGLGQAQQHLQVAQPQSLGPVHGATYIKNRIDKMKSSFQIL
jgi:hypothetical protein